MTVKELIEKLKLMPQDAIVLCSANDSETQEEYPYEVFDSIDFDIRTNEVFIN